MHRALFKKTGNAVYISHLDLMRLFQRAFKRAGLQLTHTQGFNPRPSVSIALPMSVGVESCCELLDFDLEGEAVSCEEIMAKLNGALVEGVEVLDVYECSRKIREIALLDCTLHLEYDNPLPADGIVRLKDVFAQASIVMEKRNRNGVSRQDIIPLIKHMELTMQSDREVRIHARICCQNPALNPMQMVTAIEMYAPELKPDFARCCRHEIYDENGTVFR